MRKCFYIFMVYFSPRVLQTPRTELKLLKGSSQDIKHVTDVGAIFWPVLLNLNKGRRRRKVGIRRKEVFFRITKAKLRLV